MPEIMTVIERTAQMETEREIIQNQNLIHKPDSVMEYSCFEQHLTLSGQTTGGIFSEYEGYFGINDAFIDALSLDRAIYSLVFDALINYMQANFWHKYLGDRDDLQGLPGASSGFSCYAMGYVWNKAKCLNFIEPRNEQDGFYTFQQYFDMAQDPRNLPDPQQCDKWADWQDSIQTSQKMNVALNGTDNGSMFDPLETYPDLFDPTACGPAIPTGVTVPPFPGAGAAMYEEFVCVSPGCHYDGSACTR
jgi:hypothetical protein